MTLRKRKKKKGKEKFQSAVIKKERVWKFLNWKIKKFRFRIIGVGLGWVSPTIIGGSTRKLNALVINDTTHWSGVPRVFQEWQVNQGSWKTVRNSFQSPNVLQSRRQGPKMCNNKGANLSRNLTRNRILSPGLENPRTLERISDSFPGTLTYMMFLENCWNSAPICSFSPIQGTMSWLLLKFHVTRIWELELWVKWTHNFHSTFF